MLYRWQPPTGKKHLLRKECPAGVDGEHEGTGDNAGPFVHRRLRGDHVTRTDFDLLVSIHPARARGLCLDVSKGPALINPRVRGGNCLDVSDVLVWSIPACAGDTTSSNSAAGESPRLRGRYLGILHPSVPRAAVGDISIMCGHTSPLQARGPPPPGLSQAAHGGTVPHPFGRPAPTGTPIRLLRAPLRRDLPGRRRPPTDPRHLPLHLHLHLPAAPRRSTGCCD